MILTRFDPPDNRPLRVLCIGAHCDDIEIGCGGSLLELHQKHANLEVRWAVFSSNETRRRETERAARDIHGNDVDLVIHRNKDGYFPAEYGAIKDQFEQLKKAGEPDLIFTHYRQDYHQDHRVISELTASTFRSHLILEYEIPKYDGDLGNPTNFVPLDKGTCERKAEVIVSANESQSDKQWFSADTFMALMRLRGVQCNSATGYAEAFYCSKLCLSLEHI